MKKTAFPNERELQAHLANPDIWKQNSQQVIRVRREMPIGACIPDIVVVLFQEVPVQTFPPQWTYRHAAVVSILRRHKKLRIDTIARRMFDDVSVIAPTVADLEKSGAISVAKHGMAHLTPIQQQVGAEVISVEAKLSKWSDALDQAITYKAFSDRAIVAMDASFVPSSEAVRQFKSMGIGLWTVSTDSVRVIVNEKKKVTNGPDREYIITSAAQSRTQTLWTRR